MPGRVVVRFVGGRTIADTTRALALREAAGMAPVRYVPREDADMAALERAARPTRCPHQGAAGCYTVKGDGGRVAENAAWGYEAPHPVVAAIKGHLAFHAGRVEVAVEDGPARR